MTYDITKDKAILKSKGYTLVDYTSKIKTFKDIKTIVDKTNTTNNGKYVYDKLVVIIDLEIICQKIGGFKEFILKTRTDCNVIEVMHTKNTTYFDKSSSLSEVAWTSFLTREDTQICEVCTDTKPILKMMPCHTCNYKCCQACFYKRVEITCKTGKADVRCFGCREDLLILRIPKAK